MIQDISRLFFLFCQLVQKKILNLFHELNEKKEEFFIKCPGDKDLRVGMYASEDRLEKVVGHKLSDDGKTCITLFEDSKFIDRWIPSPPLIISTSFIAITAAASPILLNLIKAAVKNLIKKVTSRKSKSADEVKSDPS